jgi:hypothetical protein
VPAGLDRLKMAGFEGDANEAIRRYLDYYKTNASDVRGPPVMPISSIMVEYLRVCVKTYPRVLDSVALGLDKLDGEMNTIEYPGNHWMPQTPEEIYTFSGEIPGSQTLAARVKTNTATTFTIAPLGSRTVRASRLKSLHIDLDGKVITVQ